MSINPKVFKQVRKALGLSQQELADAIGLSRVTINKMERGRLRRGIPDEIAARLMALRPRADITQKIEAANKEIASRPFRQALFGEDNVKSDDHLWDNEEDDQ